MELHTFDRQNLCSTNAEHCIRNDVYFNQYYRYGYHSCLFAKPVSNATYMECIECVGCPLSTAGHQACSTEKVVHRFTEHNI